MMTYDKGKWIENESMPSEYNYSSAKGLIYAGYDSNPMWVAGVENAFQVKIHWPTDEHFDVTKYRYFIHVDTPFFGDGFLVTDFPSLLMALKELAPLFQDAREQELFEMRKEEHLAWAKDRRRETSDRRYCDHLLD